MAKKIIELEGCTEHKVQTGESLTSLAHKAGLTWKELCQFNFATCNRRAVDIMLHRYVGCTRRSADNSHYIFDDHDDPGIIFLPKAIPSVQLRGGEEAEIRIIMPHFSTFLELETVDLRGHPVPHISLRLRCLVVS